MSRKTAQPDELETVTAALDATEARLAAIRAERAELRDRDRELMGEERTLFARHLELDQVRFRLERERQTPDVVRRPAGPIATGQGWSQPLTVVGLPR